MINANGTDYFLPTEVEKQLAQGATAQIPLSKAAVVKGKKPLFQYTGNGNFNLNLGGGWYLPYDRDANIRFATNAIPAAIGIGAMGVVPKALGLVSKAIEGNKWLKLADMGATSYFGAKGINDLRNGKANWETALDLAPLAQLTKPLYDAGKTAFNATRNIFGKESNVDNWLFKSYGGGITPDKEATMRGIDRGIKDVNEYYHSDEFK